MMPRLFFKSRIANVIGRLTDNTNITSNRLSVGITSNVSQMSLRIPKKKEKTTVPYRKSTDDKTRLKQSLSK